MSAPKLTVPELEATVARVVDELRAPGGPRHVVVWAQPEWTGPDTLTVDDVQLRVATCASSLGVREELSRFGNGEATVILTPLRELDTDIEARIASNRVRTPDRWEALAQAFRATDLDPRIYRYRWLADELLAARPPGGYPPVHGGTLTREHALTALATQLVGLVDLQPAPVDFLLWLRSEGRRRLLATSEQVRNELVTAIAETVPFAPAAVATTLADAPTDVVVIGLVCGAVFAQAGRTPQAAAAAARLEPLLGGVRLDPAIARVWADAAGDLLAELGDDPVTGTQATAAHADALLAELDATNLAVHSDQLPVGFSHRLASLVQAMSTATAALDTGSTVDVASVWEAIDALRRHRLAPLEQRRIIQAEMAARLLAWLVTEPRRGEGLSHLAADYRDEGAWVDRARRALLDPDADPTLTAVYRDLVARVDTRRAERNNAFAHALAREAGEPDDGMIGIESVLDSVVIPLADHDPVLLVVVDGMGWDIWHELLADIAQRGWVPIAPDGELSVLAAIPTVTEVSRCSLLAGSLRVGNQQTERDAFIAHGGLRSVTTRSHPPVILHKSDLSASTDQTLTDRAGDLVGEPANKVVAAVLNATDDHLHKAGQLRVSWTVDAIRPLANLLGRARYAGRTVVVTADHGHIVEAGTVAQVADGGGERWRTADRPTGDGEVAVRGRRVLRGGGEVVMAWADTIRYTAARGDGYHGGASPQEALVPIEVLVPVERAHELPEGWHPRHRRQPVWWRPRAVRVSEASPVPVGDAEEQAPSGRPTPKQRPSQDTLFDHTVAGGDSDGWIGELLRSSAFAQQRTRLGGRPLPVDRIASLLEALVRNGGRLTRAEIAEATGTPLARVQGLVASVARLLNIDGYPVLQDDGNLVVLDEGLARAQFGLGR